MNDPTGGLSARDIVELRVHGVTGTPPEAMLEDPYPEAVSGDDIAVLSGWEAGVCWWTFWGASDAGG